MRSLLEEEYGLSGSFKLLRGDKFLLFLSTFSYCSLAASGMISVLNFLIFA